MNDPLDPQTLSQARALFNQLRRHFVSLRVEFQKRQARTSELYSAFLLSVTDEWILITAGHCIERVSKIQNAGYSLVTSELIDGLASDSKYRHPVPLNYVDADPTSLDSEGFDCGILRLSYNQRQLLEANGKVP